MKQTILVAGGTGKVGEKIVKALIKRGANVRAIVRTNSASENQEKLSTIGAEVVISAMTTSAALEAACQGVFCVVSALSGMRNAIVDAQSQLLNAAVAAGVPRFIPSDYATDFTQAPEGENRSFDWHKEFYRYVDQSLIAATSIMNGAFADLILGPGAPLYDTKNNSVSYWGDKSDWENRLFNNGRYGRLYGGGCARLGNTQDFANCQLSDHAERASCRWRRDLQATVQASSYGQYGRA